MNKIKVAFVINDLLLGGAQRIVIDIVTYLDKEKISCEIIALKDYENEGRKTFTKLFQEKGIPVSSLSLLKISKIKKIQLLYKKLKSEKPDVLHLMLPDSIVIGTIAGRLAGVKQIIVHEMNTHGSLTWRLRYALKFLRIFSRLTIAYSETLEKEFCGESHHLTQPVTELPFRSCTIFNGVDTVAIAKTKNEKDRKKIRESLGVSDDEILIFCAGRLIGWKAQDLLLQAFQKIAGKFLNAKLVIVGDGPLLEKLENLKSKTPEFSDRIQIMGARNDVFDLLLATDIYSLAIVWPKGQETISLGLASMEAMAFGLASIGSEYKDQYVGIESYKNIILVEPGNIEELAKVLEYLITNKDKRIEMGNQAAEYVKKYFSSPEIVKIYQSVYEVLSNNK